MTENLFKDVKYYVTGKLDPKVKELLDNGGASNSKFMVDYITHVICGVNFDENEISQALDLYELPSVTEAWVLASVKLGRLATTKAYEPSGEKLFAGCRFALCDMTAKDRKTLFATLTFHGAQVERNFTERSTHLVCTAASGQAYAKALALGDRVSVVTPDWVNECVQSKARVDAQAFHPRLLVTAESQKAPVEMSQQTLASIIGFDFEEGIAKTELPVPKAPIATAETVSTPQSQPPKPQMVATQPAVRNKLILQQQPGGPRAVMQQQLQNKSLQQQFQLQIRQTTPTLQNPVSAAAAAFQPAPQQMKQTEISSPQISQSFPTEGNQTIIRQQLIQQSAAPQQMIQQQAHIIATPASQQMIQQHVLTAHAKAGASQPPQQVQFIQATPQQAQKLKAGAMIQIQQNTQVLNSQQQQIFANQLQSGGNLVGQQMQNKHIIMQQQSHAQPSQQQQNIVIINQSSLKQSVPQQGAAQVTQAPVSQATAQAQPQQQIMGQQQPQNIQYLHTLQHQQQQQQQMTFQMQQKPQLNMSGGQIVQQNAPSQLPPQNQPGQPQQIVQQIVQGAQQSGGQVPQRMVTMAGQQQQTAAGQQQWTTPQGPYVRAARPHWQGGAPAVPQRQLIHLDAQTHAHLQTLDPVRRAEYIAKLQNKQRGIMLRHQIFPAGVRPGAAPPGIVTAQLPAGGHQHILIQSQMPGGLSPQSKAQWIRQNRPLLVRQTNAPGLSPISQQTSGGGVVQQPTVQPAPAAGGQFHQVDAGAATPPHYQRVMLQMQQGVTPGQAKVITPAAGSSQSAAGQTVMPRAGFPAAQAEIAAATVDGGQSVQPQQQTHAEAAAPAGQMINKTKTALANMLNSRLSGANNGAVGTPGVPESEPSAAGTLRMMTAQHNAALSLSGTPRTPQDIIAMQRRTLGNITNSATVGSPVVAQVAQGQLPIVVPQSPSAGGPLKNTAPFSPGRTPLPPRPQFYGHNPNLKLPPDLFLLGCTFFVVEYDETNKAELPAWRELIQKHGGEIESFYCQKVTHVLCRTQRHGVVMQAIRDSKRCVTAYWLNDTILRRQVQPPWQAIHLPAPSTFGMQKPATRHIIAISGFEGDERQRIKNMVEESGGKFTGYFSKQNTVLICKKPEGAKYRRAKDWAVPVVNATWLSDILLGNLSSMSQYEITKYQQYNLMGPFRIEYGLVPHLMTAWKSPINLTQESHEKVKRCLSEPQSAPKPKKIRTLPPLEPIPDEIVCTKTPEGDEVPKILFSQVDNLDGLTRAVTSLGGIVVQNPLEATHLVMTRLTRTHKLLLAMCVVKHIVSTQWLMESAKEGSFQPLDAYVIKDATFEDNFKCDIHETVKNPNRGQLFDGKTFYITPSVRPAVRELTQMIEASGGKVEKARRSVLKIQEANAQLADSYIILSCANDLHLLADLTRSGKQNRIICTTEFVMRSIMTQSINIEPHIMKYF
ncbi:PAX-interacting protein 1 [Phlebotomus argentipes]|uniref:PAX-interacting protein 1 n=1 Tax=Phlebotomus argentipes TaxID=94469 RepID=UPI002893044D|nr:PAX-interacting protein 1 [Phlebotomus argentipes]